MFFRARTPLLRKSSLLSGVVVPAEVGILKFFLMTHPTKDKRPVL